MFSLKLALAVVVIFFLLYNGASIFSSDKSGLQKNSRVFTIRNNCNDCC